MTLDTLSPLTKFLRIGGRRPGSLQAVSRQLCPTSAEPRRGNHECAIAGAMIATRCTYALSLAWWAYGPVARHVCHSSSHAVPDAMTVPRSGVRLQNDSQALRHTPEPPGGRAATFRQHSGR